MFPLLEKSLLWQNVMVSNTIYICIYNIYIMYIYEYREKYNKFNIKKLEQPGAENRASNYGPITLSQRKQLKYLQIRLA